MILMISHDMINSDESDDEESFLPLPGWDENVGDFLLKLHQINKYYLII